MKSKFSKSWNSSKQPRKQRKFRFNAPLHILSTFLSVNLSKELRQKYTKRSIRVRKGDQVKLISGQYKKKVGTVDRVDLKNTKVYVSGVDYVKKDGTKSPYPVNPSNLQIIKLDLSDKKRQEKLTAKKSEVKN